MSQATVTRLQPRPARLTAVQRRLEAYGEVVELIAGKRWTQRSSISASASF
ncbi:hypothetical protein Thi970DRAFT_00442 [Thiorhodovibrio frisius]|uniref:Uncharacterized protein n=1 Tax=Thiorhodovibrio frisius TaxID=631362 RepID=H8YWI1_9GAMM|nr:hypothetical protein Thi970DRAFT_00442 [Thiorhodovibrio frisius]WPL22936.1 hypothetical protein Thiofri_03114 [Thiorhodovibrio frisius]